MSLVIYRSEDKALFMDNIPKYYCFLFLEICLITSKISFKVLIRILIS